MGVQQDVMPLPFSAAAGTVFHDSHPPLWKWFLAIFLIGESKKGSVRNSFSARLASAARPPGIWPSGVLRYGGRFQVPLKEIVEIDETWVGGLKRQRKGESNRADMVLGASAKGWRGSTGNARRLRPGVQSLLPQLRESQRGRQGRNDPHGLR